MSKKKLMKFNVESFTVTKREVTCYRKDGSSYVMLKRKSKENSTSWGERVGNISTSLTRLIARGGLEYILID